MNHGLSAYRNNKCRCDVCRTASTRYQQEWQRLARFTGPPPGVEHGRYSTYRNYACRCEPCRSSQAAALREYRGRQP